MGKQLFKAKSILGTQWTPYTRMAVEHGRVVALGQDHDFDTWLDGSTEIVDLDDRVVIPGFVESHAHLLMMGQTRHQVDTSSPPNHCIGDILARIQEAVDRTPPGSWIVGFHYDEGLLAEGRPPSLAELTRVAPDHPVYLTHNSGHLAVVNQRALDVARVTRDTTIPGIQKDGAGNLTGLLKEAKALESISQWIPRPTTEQYINYIDEASQLCLSVGVTSMTDAAMGLGDPESSQKIWQAYQKASQTGHLKVRTECYARVIDTQSFVPDWIQTEWLQAGGVKLFSDGSIQGHTGALCDPYLDEPGHRGMLLYSVDELTEIFRYYHQQNRQIIIHGNGDRAIYTSLKAYDHILGTQPNSEHRHRIEHSQMVSSEGIQEMKRLGILPSFFVGHVYYFGDRHRDKFLGSERASRISPLKEALNAGLIFSLHSDCPVTPINPLHSIRVAVERRTREGKVLGSNQRIGVHEAFHAYTDWAAYLGFREHLVGSLKPGLWADFSVLEGNPFTWSAGDSPNEEVQIESTWTGGQIAYHRG